MPSNEQFRFADANRPPQLLNMGRKADFASALSNTMVRQGKTCVDDVIFDMGETIGKVDFSMSKTQRKSMAIILQLTEYAYHGVCKRSGLCID